MANTPAIAIDDTYIWVANNNDVTSSYGVFLINKQSMKVDHYIDLLGPIVDADVSFSLITSMFFHGDYLFLACDPCSAVVISKTSKQIVGIVEGRHYNEGNFFNHPFIVVDDNDVLWMTMQDENNNNLSSVFKVENWLGLDLHTSLAEGFVANLGVQTLGITLGVDSVWTVGLDQIVKVDTTTLSFDTQSFTATNNATDIASFQDWVFWVAGDSVFYLYSGDPLNNGDPGRTQTPAQLNNYLTSWDYGIVIVGDYEAQHLVISYFITFDESIEVEYSSQFDITTYGAPYKPVYDNSQNLVYMGLQSGSPAILTVLNGEGFGDPALIDGPVSLVAAPGTGHSNDNFPTPLYSGQLLFDRDTQLLFVADNQFNWNVCNAMLNYAMESFPALPAAGVTLASIDGSAIANVTSFNLLPFPRRTVQIVVDAGGTDDEIQYIVTGLTLTGAVTTDYIDTSGAGTYEGEIAFDSLISITSTVVQGSNVSFNTGVGFACARPCVNFTHISCTDYDNTGFGNNVDSGTVVPNTSNAPDGSKSYYVRYSYWVPNVPNW